MHPIDGDGLLCAITFAGSGVRLQSRFIRSAHRVAEGFTRTMLARGQMGSKPATKDGWGTASVRFLRTALTGSVR